MYNLFFKNSTKMCSSIKSKYLFFNIKILFKFSKDIKNCLILSISSKLDEILFSLSPIFDKLDEILFSLSPIFDKLDEILFSFGLIFDKLDEILFSLSHIFDKLDETLFSLSPIFDNSPNFLSYPLSFNKILDI